MVNEADYVVGLQIKCVKLIYIVTIDDIRYLMRNLFNKTMPIGLYALIIKNSNMKLEPLKYDILTPD